MEVVPGSVDRRRCLVDISVAVAASQSRSHKRLLDTNVWMKADQFFEPSKG